MAKRKEPYGCLFLFSIPFAGVGTLFIYLIFYGLWEWRSMQGWESKPARIQSVELESYTSDGSTTYDVLAQYVYDFNGTQYQSDRVSLFSGADNLGDYHKELYEELKRAYDQGETIDCFVNPRTPSEAVLDRSMRWGLFLFYLVFLVCFGGVGFGLMAFTGYKIFSRFKFAKMWSKTAEARRQVIVKSSSQNMAKSKVTQTSQDEELGPPISVDPKGVIVLHTPGQKKVLRRIRLTFLINIFAMPLGWFLWPSVLAGELVALTLFLFPLLGALFILGSVLDWLAWRKFGISTLSMPQEPRSSSTYEAILTNKSVLRYEKGFAVEMQGAVGKQAPFFKEAIEVVPQKHGTMGLYLPITFDIPQLPVGSVSWKITITADIPGLDFHASFEWITNEAMA